MKVFQDNLQKNPEISTISSNLNSFYLILNP